MLFRVQLRYGSGLDRVADVNGDPTGSRWYTTRLPHLTTSALWVCRESFSSLRGVFQFNILYSSSITGGPPETRRNTSTSPKKGPHLPRPCTMGLTPCLVIMHDI